MVASRALSLSPPRSFCSALTGSAVMAAMERPASRMLSATGLRRAPLQLAQILAPCSTASVHFCPSPLSSPENSSSAAPVPWQASHQPCAELNDSRRGSGSGKPRLQEEKERRPDQNLAAP